jgi:hypothetical protein
MSIMGGGERASALTIWGTSDSGCLPVPGLNALPGINGRMRGVPPGDSITLNHVTWSPGSPSVLSTR